MNKYREKPLEISTMPTGIPQIIGNEAAERFSFYGMRALLIVFMTQYLMNGSGELDVMSEEDAKYWFHIFLMSLYGLGFLGAILSDGFLGKYRTILYLSVVYCLGHLALAMDETRVGLAIGLGLIALGSGGIKPCVSAHVGDQFCEKNVSLRERVFGWFYLSINAGAFISMLLTPWLLENHGPSWAFGVPGIAMLLATIFFWSGRNKFAHIPPAGPSVIKELFSLEGLRSLWKIMVFFLCFVSFFWAIYDQTGSAWVLQAERMDRNIFGWEILSAQVQTVNPVMIILFTPLFTYFVYPIINSVWKLNQVRKMGIGFVLAATAFLISAWIESQLNAGVHLSIWWQILAFAVITSAEVMVSITCLDFAYSQAPNKFKSLVMAIFLASVAVGNLIAALVNAFISNDDGTSMLEGGAYYLFFAGLMLAATVVFAFFTRSIQLKE